jgi:hypothetical protein
VSEVQPMWRCDRCGTTVDEDTFVMRWEMLGDKIVCPACLTDEERASGVGTINFRAELALGALKAQRRGDQAAMPPRMWQGDPEQRSTDAPLANVPKRGR